MRNHIMTSGMDYQGRHVTRPRFEEQEWVDTICVASTKLPRLHKMPPPPMFSKDDLVMCIFIVGAIAAFCAWGPWL